MFRKNQKGVIDPVFVVVLVILLAIGLAVYWRSSQKKYEVEPQVSETIQQPEVESNPMLPGISYEPLEGFEEQTCDTTQDSLLVLMYPSGGTVNNCEDRTNIVLVSKHEWSGQDLLACMTEQELKKYRKLKPMYKYDCEVVEINGNQATKVEQQAVEEFDSSLGGGPQITYTFAPSFTLFVTYFSDENGNFEHTEEFNNFIQSINFE